MAVSQNKVVTTQVVATDLAVCTAACTTYGDTANKVLLITAGPDGSLVYRIRATPRATVTATQLQYYLSKDGGATLSLIGTELMSAYTMAATTKAPTTDWSQISEDAPMRLAGGATPDRIYVAIGVALAGGVVFEAERENF